MEKKKENSKVDATGDQPIHSKEENNLHSKIVNSINNVNTVKDKSSCDMDIKPVVEEKSCNTKFVEPVQDSIKKRRRSRRLIPCSSPNNSNSEETDEKFARTRKVVMNKSKQSECKEEVVKKKEYVASLALSKITHDVKIDQNVVDRYTERVVPEVPEAMMPLLESPETKRRRIESENMVVARQCRLHPANKKYNQGPVVNPPLISPGKMVGYTPAGQRHEVDLNFERPTWFNSEYARMQFDDATRINVSRMFHDLQTGHFLPDTLDANVERRYFAEQQLVTNEATEHFKQNVHLSPESQHSTADEEYLSLLESEQQLIQLNEFAVVKLQDFPAELASRLKNALMLELTPLMFKKNPIIVETIEKLSSQRVSYDVAVQARALLGKIKGLFDVPKSLTFREYFAAEVESLMEKTKDMNTYDLMMMTDEPSDECSIGKGTQESNPPEDFGPAKSNSEEGITELGAVDNGPISDNDNSVIAGDARIVGPVSFPGPRGDGPATLPSVNIFSQFQNEWIPVEDGEEWQDTSNDETYDSFSTREDIDEDSDLSETESELTDDDSDAWTTSYESDESDDDVFMEVTNLINGMVIIHGLPGFLVYDIFEYI